MINYFKIIKFIISAALGEIIKAIIDILTKKKEA